MQPRCSTCKGCLLGIAGLAILAICALSGRAGPALDKKRPPKPLPPEIVTAWKEAGAEVGWMRESTFDLPEKVGPEFLPEKEGTAGDLPAFRCAQLKKRSAGETATGEKMLRKALPGCQIER